MSDAPQPRPAARAADIAAEEVSRLVAETEAALKRMQAEARRDLAQIKAKAKREADEITAQARTEAIRLGQDARREADERIAAAQAAADEVLEEARALSRGMRQLAGQLTDHASRILADVQSGHRRMSASLRALPGGGAPAPEETARPVRRSGRAGGNPFEDLDVPSWVGDG